MNNIFICKICNKEFNSLKALTLHLKLHKISSEEYYKKFLLKPNEGFCKICGKPTKYHSISTGFILIVVMNVLEKTKMLLKNEKIHH